jgi:HAMP domain-containing protein
MFLAAGHRSLIRAGLGALMLAGILSVLLTRKVLRPLAQMSESTRRITAGDYTARVLIASNDEVVQVATAFNSWGMLKSWPRSSGIFSRTPGKIRRLEGPSGSLPNALQRASD